MTEVPTSLVDPNPFNARAFYDDAVIARLSREIRADGQLVVGSAVRSSAPDRYTLIDGHYRLKAIIAAGIETILLDVRDPMPDIELFRLSSAMNEHRTPPTALDNAFAWSRLLASGTVSSQGALEAITGKSVAMISKTLRILGLPEDVLGIVKAHPARFSARLGYSLAQLCAAGSTKMARRLAERAVVDEISAAEMDRLVFTAQPERGTRQRRKVTEMTRVDGNGFAGTIKSSASGKVAIEMTFAEPARAVNLIEQFKRLVVTTP